MWNNKIRYLDHVFGEEDDIKKGNCYLVGTLLGDSLSINTLEFDVESDDSTLTQFKRNDPVIYEHNGKQIGIFYVQNIERIGATTYSFSAVSALGILAEGKHYGGIYTGQTVAEILPDICGTVPYEIKTNLTEIKLYGWLPIASPRDNLAQVLFAIGAMIKTDLGGVLRIESLWDGISGELTQNQMYEGPSVKYNSAVTQVVVTEHQYVEGGEETKLFEGTAQQGDIITFNSPMYELVADGFSILESGANYAKVSGGSGTLKGRAYIHNTREVVRDVSEAAEPNIKTVKDATLVSLVNSTAVAERLANYFQWTETIQAPIVYQGEVPGNRVATWHPYDKTGVTACLESADINLSNTLKADETLLVGFVPPKFEQVVTYDEHEVLTGSGTWTVPEGVTQVVVVLIGGGGAGGNGDDGTGDFYGGFGTSKNETKSVSIYPSDSAGQTKTTNCTLTATGNTTEKGTGGAGGKAGEPGKVYQKTIDVSAGDKISYICGSGGQANGAGGEDTVFGEESSASGSAESAGYTDIVTGITYAKSGTPGSAGADGGTPGNNGDDDGETAGGIGRQPYNDSENGNNESSTANYSVTLSVNISVSSSGSGGGGAGGRSGQNDGTAGSSSGPAKFGYSIANASGTFTPSNPGTGGNGADGASAALYGCGGDGGGGGGGGGAAGSYTLTVRNNGTYKVISPPSSTLKLYNTTSIRTYDNYSGSGGAGGAGGAGGDGCIILYYGAQKKIESGPVMDRTGRFILDKLGRRIVV